MSCAGRKDEEGSKDGGKEVQRKGSEWKGREGKGKSRMDGGKRHRREGECGREGEGEGKGRRVEGKETQKRGRA